MERIDSRKLPEAALNERRRRAVKLRLAGVSVREAARQCELSATTVVKAHQGLSPWRLGGGEGQTRTPSQGSGCCWRRSKRGKFRV